jgi:hypothetical protein
MTQKRGKKNEVGAESIRDSNEESWLHTHQSMSPCQWTARERGETLSARNTRRAHGNGRRRGWPWERMITKDTAHGTRHTAHGTPQTAHGVNTQDVSAWMEKVQRKKAPAKPNTCRHTTVRKKIWP